MRNWIRHPVILESRRILLVPLVEQEIDQIVASSLDERIWTYLPIQGTASDIRTALQEAIQARAQQTQYPFSIVDKQTGQTIGTTRLLKLDPINRTLEIGWTWYLPIYWGTGYNEECKLLLLNYCFEDLKTIRVAFIAGEKNIRSRKAIERLGAKFEGIFRNVAIRHDGKRSSACYSIIDEEWPETKVHLENLVNSKLTGAR
ncbi:MAG: GNAT family N-acetyltransferase [Chitinophaga sp.]|uniref:GNAT family N-acetyltransferase n=1 Tax=Chitinophaga sp. TaxID=1869181 RepID=UPI0025BF9548|nr:GNAT family protein [Chitinophaga sp.]MBV8252650.1 GNAT family N-acetyltransferase [Chitinophaga sp.]